MADMTLNMPDSKNINASQTLVNIEQLFTEARPRLVRLARLNNVMPDCIEDVVQETLVEAWRHLENLRDPQRFDAWLNGICRNVCRRQKSASDNILSLSELLYGSLSGIDEIAEMGIAVDILDPSTPDPLEELSQQDLTILIGRALGHLPAHTRELLEMCYLAEIPQREAAERLGLTIGALELRLHRARRQLRQIFNGTLRADAQSLGLLLDPEDAQNWQEMHHWCWLCGKHKMLGRFETQADGHRDFCMRCPECSSRYDMLIMRSHGPSSFEGLRTFRPALKRTIQDLSRLSSWTTTEGTCYRCQGPANIRIFQSSESQILLPPDRYWVISDCSACGNPISDIAAVVLAHPTVQHFTLLHKRLISEPYHLVDYNGIQAIRVCIIDATHNAQLTIMIDAQTLRCLATFTT